MGKNAIVGQSGGPTSVINASLAGVFESCKSRGAEIVYGMCNGVAGLLEERVVDLSTVLTDDLDNNVRDAISMSGKRLGAMARFASNKWLSATSGLVPEAFFSAASDIRINLWKRTVPTAGMVGKYIRESSAAEDVALYPKTGRDAAQTGAKPI